MALVFDLPAEKVTSTERLVLLALADHAADDGTNVYPSVATVARKTSLNERTIRRTLAHMRGNALRVVRESAQHSATEYAIDVRVLESLRDDPKSTLTRADRVSARADRVSARPDRVSARPDTRSAKPSVTVKKPPKEPSASARKTRGAQKPPIPKAVEVYREIAERYPKKALWQDITATIGDADADMAMWRNVVKGYIGQGWNPSNVANMLTFFKRGEMPSAESAGNTGRKDGHHATDRTGAARSETEYTDQQLTAADLVNAKRAGQRNGT